MGLLRLLLAISVVSAHHQNHFIFYLVGGTVAVKTFYIISGFYMAMIINSYKDNISFYKSRYLRLFPVYFFCVLITFFLGEGATLYNVKLFDNDQIPFLTNIFLLFTNIFIFFQDVVLFIGVKGGDFFFTGNLHSSDLPLRYFLFIPQGWTLGLEISFYLIAPFIIKKRNIKLIISIIFLSLLLRIILNLFDLKGDPWTYRFFPSELALFLLGSLSYYFFSNLKIKVSKKIIYLFFILISLMTVCYSFITIPGRSIIYFILVACSLWFIFQKTKNNKIDKFLGELSYPVYCSHFVVLHFIFYRVSFLNDENLSFLNSLIIIFIVIVISEIIYFIIHIPIDKYRKIYKKKWIK